VILSSPSLFLTPPPPHTYTHTTTSTTIIIIIIIITIIIIISKTKMLPKCEKCGSTADWWDGSHNLINLQAANRKDLANQILKEKVSSTKIQQAYRFYLRRRWGRAEVVKQIVNAMLIHRASSCIQSILVKKISLSI
jgi:hypothetical protein